MIVLFCLSCQKKDEADETSNLSGTNWKLAGIVDTKTGVLTKIEPKDCEKCYTLTFDTDTTFSTFSSSNELGGNYTVDVTKRSICIVSIGGTKLAKWVMDNCGGMSYQPSNHFH